MLISFYCPKCRTPNISYLYLNPNGYFGNVADPLAPLHFDGDIIFNSLASTTNGLVYSETNGKLRRISFTGNNRHVLLGDGTFGVYADDDWLVIGNNMFVMPTGTVSFGVEEPDASYKVEIGGDTKIHGELSVGNSIRFNGVTDQITTTTGTLDFGNTNILTTGNINANQLTFTGTTTLTDAEIENLTVTQELKIGTNTLILSSNQGTTGVDNSIYSESGDLKIQSQNTGNLDIKHTIINSGNDGNVGIGTPNPDKKLHVKTSETNVGLEESPGSLRLEHEIIGVTSSIWDISPTAVTSTGYLNRLDFIAPNSSTIPVLSLQKDGKVGVGIKTPTAKLHVLGDLKIESAMPIIHFIDNDFIDNDGYRVDFSILNNNGVGRIVSDGSVSVFINGDNTADNNYFSIYNNNTHYGAPSPLPIFRAKEGGLTEIWGNVNIRATPTTDEHTQTTIKLNNDGKIWTLNSTKSYGFGIGADNNLHIYKNAIAPVELMTFNDNGNVAIGNPITIDAKLHVAGNVKIEGLLDNNTATQMLVTDPATGIIGKQNIPELCSAITCNNGKVGIGTPNPLSKLHIKDGFGTILLESSTSGLETSYLDIAFTDPSFVEGTSGNAFDNRTWVFRAFANQTDYGRKFQIWSKAGEPLIITNADLGIGTYNPEAKLHVAGDVKIDNLPPYSSATEMIVKDPTSGKLGTMPVPDISSLCSAITCDGYGNATMANDVILAGTNKWILHSPDDGRSSLYIAPFGSTVWNLSAGTEFKSNGNVGFGAYATDAKVHIKQNGSALNLEGTDHVYIQFFPDGYNPDIADNNRKAWIGYSDVNDNNLTIQNQITDADIILGTTGNGNVGIGTTNPTEKLCVNGKIKVKEEIIIDDAGDWSDYVFDKDYKMLSIPELENYINENKHLPNIPSAKVVETEGLHIMDMNRRMMEKIEELTLYIIDLEKRLKSIENNNK